MINQNICLSDIPKDKIYKAKNGKSYTNITVTEMRDRDKNENTHTIYMSQSKEEKGQEKVYIGKGREIIFNNSEKPYVKPTYKTEPIINKPNDEPIDDLPF
jgi:hypothetical protein